MIMTTRTSRDAIFVTDVPFAISGDGRCGLGVVGGLLGVESPDRFFFRAMFWVQYVGSVENVKIGRRLCGFVDGQRKARLAELGRFEGKATLRKRGRTGRVKASF